MLNNLLVGIYCYSQPCCCVNYDAVGGSLPPLFKQTFIYDEVAFFSLYNIKNASKLRSIMDLQCKPQIPMTNYRKAML